MPVSNLPSAKGFEEKGHADIEFVGFRYTGDASVKVDHGLQKNAGYNGPPKFQQGRTYLALLPTWLDDNHVANSHLGVRTIEVRNDFEIIYDPVRLSKSLLGRNYLPPDVFYEGFDRYKRRKVMEKLGLEDVGRVFTREDEAPWRKQLREIADVEIDEEEARSQKRVDEYTSRFSRSEAVDIVKVLREGPDEINLNRAGLTEMSEYMAEHDAETVETAIGKALESPK